MATARVGQHELHYVQRGAGEPLLLIQGLSGNHLHWREDFLTELERDFEVTAYDNRGMGRSGRVEGSFTIADLAEDALGLMDAIGLDRAHVLGISMGGMIAQELALRAPQRLLTLTLGCTNAGGPRSTPSNPDVFRPLVEAMMRRDRDAAIRASWEMNVSKAFAAKEQAWQEHRRLATELPAPAPVIMEQLRAAAVHDVAEHLGRIEAPTLVIHGTEDVVIEPDNSRVIAAAIPDARLELLEGVGHMFWVEQPERSAQLIREHALAAASR